MLAGSVQSLRACACVCMREREREREEEKKDLCFPLFRLEMLLSLNLLKE